MYSYRETVHSFHCRLENIVNRTFNTFIPRPGHPGIDSYEKAYQLAARANSLGNMKMNKQGIHQFFRQQIEESAQKLTQKYILRPPQ